MENHLLPDNCTSKYWIYADYPRYIFKKTREKRAQGKWLIFEKTDKINSTWELVKNATESGKLGPYSKVSTQKRSSKNFEIDSFVICIYTEDFQDKDDVARVENQIRELGIKNDLHYKLNKDAGKYEFEGHDNLIQLTSKVIK